MCGRARLMDGIADARINVLLALYPLYTECYAVDLSKIAGFILFIPVLSLIDRFLYQFSTVS